jgi:hypothetical protein
MYCQRYGVNETINDSTTGSIGQGQHSIPQCADNNSYQILRAYPYSMASNTEKRT